LTKDNLSEHEKIANRYNGHVDDACGEPMQRQSVYQDRKSGDGHRQLKQRCAGVLENLTETDGGSQTKGLAPVQDEPQDDAWYPAQDSCREIVKACVEPEHQNDDIEKGNGRTYGAEANECPRELDDGGKSHDASPQFDSIFVSASEKPNNLN
jgi:hypothetical protein